MNVLVCPTAYKGSLPADVAADAMARGALAARADARVRRLPLSDGGSGLLEALSGHRTVAVSEWEVRGPLDATVRGRCLWWGPSGRKAVIESADACGLHLLGDRKAPLEAHTAGVGQLVRRAVDAGAEKVWIGLGGSASTDGGTGLAREYGYRFLDRRGDELPLGGGPLAALDRIEPGRPPPVPCAALADVTIPLVGPQGAARTFAPQKGADPGEVERLAVGLERLDIRLRTDLERDVGRLPGAGAAGGLGAGCAAFLDARLVPGADWVLEAVEFDSALADADLVITGEGAFDETSRRGKVVGRVLERASAREVAVVLACGVVEAEAPEAALALDAGGGTLDEEGLAELVEQGIRDLARGRPSEGR